jgi:hypothetical protein
MTAPLEHISIEKFVEPDRVKKYECPVCSTIMKTVYEFDKCGHLCCEKCVLEKKCVVCKTDSDWHESKYMTRELGNYLVKCSISGCNDVFPYHDDNEHKNSKHQESDGSYKFMTDANNSSWTTQCCDCVSICCLLAMLLILAIYSILSIFKV